MTSVRIDKWLWAARFFKTRAQASQGLRSGPHPVQRSAAKPAREVRVGDRLRITTRVANSSRSPAAQRHARPRAGGAELLYRETEESKAARLKAAAERKAMQEFAPLPVTARQSATAAESSSSAANIR